MNAHSLKVLEYGNIIDMLVERTACALGEDFARRLQPSADRLLISEGQRETTEAARIIREDGSLPLGGIHDIRALVGKASVDSLLQPAELLQVAGTLASAIRLRNFIAKRATLPNPPATEGRTRAGDSLTPPRGGGAGGGQTSRLMEIAANITPLPHLERAVVEAISDKAEVRDTASPELARIRSKLKTLHARMMDKLNAFIHGAQYKTMIQDPVITQRGDRYCIPVKSEHRHGIPGIVHDSSASGATVFIEPAVVVEIGNEMRALLSAEQQEVERILRRLTGMVAVAAPELRLTIDALGRIDFASAKGRLSCDMDAIEPELNFQGQVDIIQARHPLLTGPVVPIDVELGKRFKTLLITGPNTGGKTVTLKTVGLLTLMAQSGLHVPAKEGSKLAVFDQVFADIGDEQSIQQSLSTFSSHMTNIVNIVGLAGKNSLVLLDELGAGTDPAEGAALAKSILDHLVEAGARTVATTHYGELKEFAFVREGVENASVEFDLGTLRPTYKLMIGVPGSSNAFAIASRLGLPDDIIERARGMIQGGEKSEEIIRRIEETHKAATERRQIAERREKDAEILKSRYEHRLEEIEELRREMRMQVAAEVDRRVKEKVAELDEIILDLKTRSQESGDRSRNVESVVQKSRERFKRRVRELKQEVDDALEPEYEEPDEDVVLRKGDTVTVTTFGLDGQLLGDPSDGEAQVMIGSMKVNVPVAVLRPARRPKSKKTEPASEAMAISTSKAGTVSPELKLIAQRVEQAVENLDKYLDDAYLAGLPSARIIHGMGTGALRKAVWDYLKNHHAVESFRLGERDEGGSGATVVTFKKT